MLKIVLSSVHVLFLTTLYVENVCATAKRTNISASGVSI